MAEPNVLLLDEPTNDLDIDTLQQLEDLLDSWPGTMVVVSHDRYLTERVCDRVVGLFGDGRIRDLPGGIPEYLRRRAAALAAGVGPVGVGEGAPRPVGGGGAGGRAAEKRAARKEVARIERRIERLDAREKELHGELAEAASDAARVPALDAELRALVTEREELEEAWLESAVLQE